MKLKPLAEAMLYALAEAEFGPMAREWLPGMHARFGVILDNAHRQRRLRRLVGDIT